MLKSIRLQSSVLALLVAICGSFFDGLAVHAAPQITAESRFAFQYRNNVSASMPGKSVFSAQIPSVDAIPTYSEGQPPDINPVPSISKIAPEGIVAGASQCNLLVRGSDFVIGSVVTLDGHPQATVFLNSGNLSATIPASELATARSASVTVVNPSPGGGRSDSTVFTVARSYEYCVSISHEDHQCYGFTYPVTYCFSIPAASTALAAFVRSSTTETWERVPEFAIGDLFNGVQAARFDYHADKAFISLSFAADSDIIYLKVVTEAGDACPTDYLGITDFYDDRKISVVISMDDIGTSPPWGGNQKFLDAANLFSSTRVWWTAGILTWGNSVNWTAYQSGVDLGYLEIAAHSRSHADPPYQDYDFEIGGSKADIIDNLSLPFAKADQEYVWCWIEPDGLTDDTANRKMGEYRYLVSRLADEIPAPATWAPWDPLNIHYSRVLNSMYLDISSLSSLNSVFDNICQSGGIYSLWGHIGKNDWLPGGIAYQHIQHLKGRTDTWYAGMGQMYMYRYSQKVVAVAPQDLPRPLYVIGATSDDHGAIEPSGDVVAFSKSNQTFFVVPDSGFRISSVLVDGSDVGQVLGYTFASVSENHTIRAIFAEQTTYYSITSSAGPNGSISPSGTATVISGHSQTFTIQPNSGFHVASVLVDGASAGSVTTYTFSEVLANHAISATFAANVPSSYTITATASPNGSISPSGTATIISGHSQTFTIQPNSGFHVASVLVDGASAGSVTTYTFNGVLANHTISATFAANIPSSYTITATAGVNGTISPSGTATVTSGNSQTFTIQPNSGFHVAAVLVDGTSAGSVTTYTFNGVLANHTISATFAANIPSSYTITATAGVNGTISPSGTATVTTGNSQTFTIQPNSGFHVAAVLVDGTSAGSVTTYTFNGVLANHTISATFAANIPSSYTITATAGVNGTISPSGTATVTSGNSQTFTIQPNSGFHVASLLIDGTPSEAMTTYTFANVLNNHSISATFSANPVQVLGGGMPTSRGGQVFNPGFVNVVPYTNGEDYFNLPVTICSPDGVLTLFIQQGVTAKVNDFPLTSVKLDFQSAALSSPKGFAFLIGRYECLPDGASFSPGVALTLVYDPANLPPDIDVDTLTIAAMNEQTSNWDPMQCTHNKTEHTLTTTVAHFSDYAVMGKLKVAPTPSLQPAPASFGLSNVECKPSEIVRGSSYTVTSTVSNSGGTKGTYELILKINATQRESRQVSLDPGISQTVSFNLVGDQLGIYQMDLNGVAMSLTVTAPITTVDPDITSTVSPALQTPAKSIKWYTIPVIVGCVVAVAVAIGLISSRQRNRT